MRILKELRKMEIRQKQKLQNLQNFKNSEMLTQGQTIDRTGNVLGKLTGDLSLSRKDFAAELIKWFRRSIWFLAFTAAYTTSPTLLIVSVSYHILYF